MTDDNGHGLTQEQWHQVLRRAGWLRFFLMLLASSISMAAMGGVYVTMVDHRIEQNQQHLQRVDNTLSKHGRYIAEVQSSQAATETAAARLEERIAALAKTVGEQSVSLRRIERLLQELLSQRYQRPIDEEGMRNERGRPD